MQVADRRGDIAHPAGDLPEVEVPPGLASGVSVILPGAVDPIGEGASGVERHDQIRHPTVEARTQHRHDMAMVEPAIGFEYEPVVGHLVLQERRSEELEHHRPTIDRAFGAEHGGSRATPQHLHEQPTIDLLPGPRTTDEGLRRCSQTHQAHAKHAGRASGLVAGGRQSYATGPARRVHTTARMSSRTSASTSSSGPSVSRTIRRSVRWYSCRNCQSAVA